MTTQKTTTPTKTSKPDPLIQGAAALRRADDVLRQYREAGLIKRDHHVRARAIVVDEDARTVALSFSSETPVPMFGELEVLDHSDGAADFERLNNGAAVLVNHDVDQHVGVVESAEIDADRIGRAIVRFGRGEQASEVFRDVVERIRQGVSFGYWVHNGRMVKDDQGRDVFLATRWEPFELTIGSIAADPTVGPGRTVQLRTEDLSMDPEKTPAVEPVDPPAQNRSAMADYEVTKRADEIAARKVSELRQTETQIRTLAKSHGAVELGDAAIADGLSFEDFQSRLLDHIAKGGSKPEPSQRSVIHVDPLDPVGTMTKGDRQQFRMTRLIAALAYGQNQAPDASFEIDVCTAATDRHAKQNPGYSVRGTIIPDEILYVPYAAFGVDARNRMSTNQEDRFLRTIERLRAPLSAGTDTAGGHLIQTDLLSGSFIDVLRSVLAVAQLGATTLTGLEGPIAIPRKTSAAAAAILATEDADAAESAPAFDQVSMTPKTMAAYTEATRLLLLQSSIDVEALIRSDLAIAAAELLDTQSLYGSGTGGNATGIENQTGVAASPATGTATPSWAQTVDQETALANAKGLRGNLGYLFGPTTLGHYKKTARFPGDGDRPILDVDGNAQNTLNGYRWALSHTVVNGDTFFGNWADLIIGLWGGLDLTVDPYTHSLKGRVRIVMHNTFDIAVRHGTSFVQNDV